MKFSLDGKKGKEKEHDENGNYGNSVLGRSVLSRACMYCNCESEGG